MPVKKRIDKKRADGIPPGILRYLLDEPFDPNADNAGLLQTFQHSREELLKKYWPMLTPAERRRASRVRAELDGNESDA